jgi:arabinose operon protein AraL
MPVKKIAKAANEGIKKRARTASLKEGKETKKPVKMPYSGNAQKGSATPDLDLFDAFFFDVDGVLWLDGTLIEGASETIQTLRDMGKRVMFLSNRSTSSRKDYANKLVKSGIEATSDDVIPSTYAAAVHISRRSGPSRVHAIGVEGLIDEIVRQGHILSDSQADYVVLGYKAEAGAEEVAHAIRLAAAGAELLACNKDPGIPMPDGTEGPSARGMIMQIEEASGKTAHIVGKPGRTLFDIAMRQCGLDAKRCVMVGDSLEADIAGAAATGMRTVLVLTGLTKRRHLQGAKVKPDYVIESVSHLLGAARKH